MTNIQAAFQQGKAFIPFITAGDPSLDLTVQLVCAMAEAGADLIEIGIPFSDPVAEGLVIQEADARALAAGTTTDGIFAAVRQIRQQTAVPLVFMTYLNPVFVYGSERFIRQAKDCGIDGLIVPDLPYEEKGELLGLCRQYSLELISLVAPTSRERIQLIAKEAEGFLYCVSSLGVTGVRQEITTDIGEMVALAKASQDIPCAVGFGVSTPEQARQLAQSADGIIVGSAIVKLVAQYGSGSVAPVSAYVREMKAAITG